MSNSGPHRSNTRQSQHVQEWLLDPVVFQGMHHLQDGGFPTDNAPIDLDESVFSDFAFNYHDAQQGPLVMSMLDTDFGGAVPPEPCQSRDHVIGSNGSLPPQHDGGLSGMTRSAQGSEQGERRTSLEALENAINDDNSTAEPSFEDGGADELGPSGGLRADGKNMPEETQDGKGDAPPPWSETKTKAGKDRKRLPLACIVCRRKKIRCSGEKPSCKHCLRSHAPCVYKVTTRKAAPRTDYMIMLDKRLKRMEDRIIRIVPKAEQDADSSISRAMIKRAITGKSTSRKRGAEDAPSSALESLARAPSPQCSDEGRAVMRSLIDQTGLDDNELSSEGIKALPARDVQEHLAEVFFDYVYGQAYHLLHKPSYMHKLKNNALPPVLILSVCAVAARFAAQSSTTPAAKPFLRGEEWASHARDICTRLWETPNMTILTCLLILGLHEFGTCHGGRSWALGGQAIRMAFALQLHRDLEHVPTAHGDTGQLSFIDREIRRRIMWACFLMDRFNSSGNDRPMFIKEETLQIQLPVKESYFQLDIPARTELLDGSTSKHNPFHGSDDPKEHMGVAAYTIRAIAMWGRIIAYLHHGGRESDVHPLWSRQSHFANLVQQSEQLQHNLPESLRYSFSNLKLQMTEKTSSQFLLMHLSMQQNILFLHRTAATWAVSSETKDVPAEFVPRCKVQTVTAANKISAMLRDAEHAHCNVTAPFAGYCAFSATSIHIPGIFCGNPAVKAIAEPNAGTNIKFLQKTMRYWGMFQWMVDNIRTQYKKALEGSRRGQTSSQSSAAWPVLQYSDWFKRYPHGIRGGGAAELANRDRDVRDDAVMEQRSGLQSVDDFFSSLASPSSSESRAIPQGRPRKYTRYTPWPGKNTSSSKATRKTDEAAKSLSPPGSVGLGPDVARTEAKHKHSLSLNATGHPLYSVGPPPIQTPSYTTASSPNSLQSSVFPAYPEGPAQPPFFAADVSQMNNTDVRQQVPFDYPPVAQEEAMLNPSESVWQQNILGGGKTMGRGDQGTAAVNVGLQSPGRRRQSQGQIGADSLIAFDGNDLPAGWSMPFSAEPRGQHDARFFGGEAASSSQFSSALNLDPSDPVFSSNDSSTRGVGSTPTMDGLQFI